VRKRETKKKNNKEIVVLATPDYMKKRELEDTFAARGPVHGAEERIDRGCAERKSERMLICRRVCVQRIGNDRDADGALCHHGDAFWSPRERPQRLPSGLFLSRSAFWGGKENDKCWTLSKKRRERLQESSAMSSGTDAAETSAKTSAR
jgi:hypothetical protein